ncbi:uncharacterized protein AMSG_08707 [Thecamonas trahens ATCC 50062]|uniref:BTB domain-containing protein n=1 Tax=Thecamonas trahens ATCC 50062 TaxID=461836 RepID=A0A0L0DN21_THETB|nr:hypothetical protein AMSG_08707 [Thecamonas trahens ATCC 50062]KNC52813.1 hypothetical protein AMSG_08707 [Thecamonas trahens ATCC 50062]|eukprot:XP_013755122.1 hypothetical protein AMSG_08707 [Thecamonas trahens ATCC 50062]
MSCVGGDLIKVNVGGKVFVTSGSRLASVSPFFASLLSGRLPAATDDDGAYVVDRSPAPFGVLLDVLRKGRATLPQDLVVQDVLDEACFYSMDMPLDDGVLMAASGAGWSEGQRVSVPVANPADLGGKIQSDGFYVLMPDEGEPFAYFMQTCPYGRTNVIAPKTRDDDLTTLIGSPRTLVLAPTIRFTHHSAGSMFLVDEHELTVQDFGVETNWVTRDFTMRFFPSIPPLAGHVYHVQRMALQHTQGSNIVMLQFTPDGDGDEQAPLAAGGGDGPSESAATPGPAWARGSVTFTECKHTIRAMRFTTARYVLRRVQTHVTHDLRGRLYNTVAIDENGDVAAPLYVPNGDEQTLLEQDESKHAPVGHAEGDGLLWHVVIDHDRFRNSRLLSLGEMLVEEILGSQAVYMAADLRAEFAA